MTVMSPTTRIRNLRRSGVPRHLLHRFIHNCDRSWIVRQAVAQDSYQKRGRLFKKELPPGCINLVDLAGSWKWIEKP